MKTLILFRGLPGSGKTTLAKTVCNVVHSADDWFEDGMGGYDFDPTQLKQAHEDCQLRTRGAMVLDYEVIGVANTFTQEWEMEPYFELAKEYGYRISTVVVENRHGGENIHGVPNESISRMANRFEVKL